MKRHSAAIIALLGVSLFVPYNAGAFETLGEDCKSYARAVFAVAEARDNLDEPSMEELKKLHPILKELEDTEARAWLYVRMISMRLVNQRATPKALMTNSYENCIDGGGFCLLYGKNCPNN